MNFGSGIGKLDLKLFLGSLMLSLLCTPAQATCPNVDLRATMSAPIQTRFMQRFYQGSSGLCYANVAADMLTALVGKPVSALDLALQYNSSLQWWDLAWRLPAKISSPEDQIIPDGGRLEVALRQAVERFGVCDDSLLPSVGQQDLKARLVFLQKKYRTEMSPAAKLELLKKSQLLLSFPQLTLQELAATAWSNWQDNDSDFDLVLLTAKWAQLSCGQRAKLGRPSIVTVSAPFERHLSGAVSRVLNQALTRTPIGFLASTDGIYSNDKMGPIESIFGDHVMSVIGQRWNSQRNRCEFLVRDSFPQDCRRYKSGHECNNDGSFWLAHSEFDQRVLDFSYISKPSGSTRP